MLVTEARFALPILTRLSDVDEQPIETPADPDWIVVEEVVFKLPRTRVFTADPVAIEVVELSESVEILRGELLLLISIVPIEPRFSPPEPATMLVRDVEIADPM